MNDLVKSILLGGSVFISIFAMVFVLSICYCFVNNININSNIILLIFDKSVKGGVINGCVVVIIMLLRSILIKISKIKK